MTTGRATTIFYPESDGMPLPDGEYQSPIFRRVVSPLEVHFDDVEGAHVNGNTFLYYVEGDPRRNVSPDCYAVFGLSEAALASLSMEGNNTYLLWEVGKPPDYVLEIASPSTARRDLGAKRDLYARIGVGEYWRYDQTGGDFYREPLVGERLVDGEYRRLEMWRGKRRFGVGAQRRAEPGPVVDRGGVALLGPCAKRVAADAPGRERRPSRRAGSSPRGRSPG